MYFDSLQAVLHMDGHGGFVWTAYGVTLAVILWLLVAPRRRQQRFLERLDAELRRAEGSRQQGER